MSNRKGKGEIIAITIPNSHRLTIIIVSTFKGIQEQKKGVGENNGSCMALGRCWKLLLWRIALNILIDANLIKILPACLYSNFIEVHYV